MDLSFTNFDDILKSEKKYDVVYADPPWEYQAWGAHKTIAVKTKYSEMDYYELSKLRVDKISKDNSLLFLWATFPCLDKAIKLMEDWNFKYITSAFVWVKQNKKNDKLFLGLGHYTRANAELVLLGKRGKGLPILDKGIRQICINKLREHSRKPDEIRDRIVKLVGNVDKIEMFARNSVVDWDVFGDELNKFTPINNLGVDKL